MYILNSNISLIKQIGDISGEKLRELKNAFSHYPETIMEQGRPLVFKKGLSALTVQGDQITYVTQGDPEDIDSEYIVQELEKLNEILNLPQEAVLVLRIEAIEKYNLNVLEKSLDVFDNSPNVLNAEGVGYRFIVNNDGFHGDIHIEPYLKDIEQAYFNVILQSNDNINISNASELLKKLFDFVIRNAKETADALYKK